MKYSISEEILGSADDYNWEDIRLMKPTTSFDTMRMRLLRLASKAVTTRKFIVYFDSLPTIYAECHHGTIVREHYAAHYVGYYTLIDGKEVEERDLCRDHELRMKLKRGFQFGRVRGDITSWILKAPESVTNAIREAKKAEQTEIREAKKAYNAAIPKDSVPRRKRRKSNQVVLRKKNRA